jgi:ABC-2 type transport system permease protein
MSLFLAECQRFFARRFTRIMILIVLVMFALILVGLGHRSQTIGPADMAKAKARQAQIVAESHVQLTACEAANANGPAPAGSPYDLGGGSCADVFSYSPPVEAFLPQSWNFAGNAKDMILLFGGIMTLFGFAVGASFVGAEWSSGNMANMLLWRPRRLALLGTKLGALLLSVLACALALGAIWLGLLLGLAKFRGTIGHVSSGMAQSLALAGARSIVLGLVVAVAGFAVAGIGRGTVTALGIAVGYSVVVEGGGLLILHAVNVTRPERFLLSRYVAAWLDKSQTFQGPDVCTPMTSMGMSCSPGPNWYMRMHSSAEIIGIGVAILAVWAFVAFRRRDVS